MENFDHLKIKKQINLLSYTMGRLQLAEQPLTQDFIDSFTISEKEMVEKMMSKIDKYVLHNLEQHPKPTFSLLDELLNCAYKMYSWEIGWKLGLNSEAEFVASFKQKYLFNNYSIRISGKIIILKGMDIIG